MGRTGVLIATMIGAEQGREEGSVDVVATVSRMRSQRMNMIQTDVCVVVSTGLYVTS